MVGYVILISSQDKSLGTNADWLHMSSEAPIDLNPFTTELPRVA
jgi:hypothetical protein